MSDNNVNFPTPFNPGLEAITSSGETLSVQLQSFLYFVVIFGGALGVITAGVALAFFIPLLPALLCGAGIGMVYSAFAGFVNTPAAKNAVPELFGEYVDWWLAPAGYSWWFPAPIGEVNRTVHVGENSVPLSATQIEAADNVHVSTTYTPIFRVKWPLVYVRYGGGPEKALGGLFNRTMRWFVSLYKSTKLPAMRGLASEVMAGARNTLSLEDDIAKPEDLEGDTYEVDFAAGSDNNWTVRKTAESMGFEIIQVLVDDFTLPNSITAAAEQERVEEAQRRSELTEVGTLEAAMKQMKEAFPELSDAEVMRAVQAERGKIDYVHVGGEGGDFTKGAAVQTSRKRRS